MRKRRIFSSNTFRLSLKELAIVGAVIVAGVLFLLPFVWNCIEKIQAGKEFRISYDFRDDYWTYRKWAEKAAAEFPVIFLGDSVVWGMYVENGNTLPAKINGKLERQAVANLAIDGLHSVALEGLLKNYGGAIRNKTVILHFNPLWMNSRKYDLSDDGELKVNHPRLIPQFSAKYKCYMENFSVRLNVWREQNIPFFSLLNHLRSAFFSNDELNSWMVDNPYKSPFAQISMSVDPGEKENRNSCENWMQKGITAQDWEWVAMDNSYQWQAFTRSLGLLKSRGNRVCVMIGPLNLHMLTPSSLDRFRKLENDICAWLENQHVEYMQVPDLPSEMYADASHPLDKGYDIIADSLLKTSFFN